jgi:hypothetical protein
MLPRKRVGQPKDLDGRATDAGQRPEPLCQWGGDCGGRWICRLTASCTALMTRCGHDPRHARVASSFRHCSRAVGSPFRHRSMLTGIVAGLLAGALWGLVFVAPRMTAGLVRHSTSTAGRFVVYGRGRRRWCSWPCRGRRARGRRWPQMGLRCGPVRAGLSQATTGFLVLAIRDAGTEMPTLIVGTIPLWVMLLGKPARTALAGTVARAAVDGCRPVFDGMDTAHADQAGSSQWTHSKRNPLLACVASVVGRGRPWRAGRPLRC